MRETRWQCTHFRAKKPCVIGTFLHEIGVSNIPILPSTKIGLKCVHRTFRNTLTAFHFSAIIQTCRRKPRLTLDERLHSSFFTSGKTNFNYGGTKYLLSRRKKLINNSDIPLHAIESIARCILPDILAYYESKEGQKEFAKWKEECQTERKTQSKWRKGTRAISPSMCPFLDRTLHFYSAMD